MALLKDLIVAGASKFIGDAYFAAIKAGTWNGGTIGVGYGGTGTTTAPKQGGIIYGSSTTKYDCTAAGTSGYYLKSNGTSAPTWEQFSKSTVGLSNVENTALSTWKGSANITTLGTITSGTWSGSTIGVSKGGTGKTSWTQYSIPYASGTAAISEIAIGTAGQILTVNSSRNGYAWQTCENYTTVTVATSKGSSDSTKQFISSEWRALESLDSGKSWPTVAGTYAIYISDAQSGEYSGIFSVSKESTKANKIDEIPLHWASLAANTADTLRIYAATQSGVVKFSCANSTAATHTLTVKYKRII